MSTKKFNRDAMAKWYARRHLETDPGIRSIYYLPEQAPEREIRLLEVNGLMPERRAEHLEPLDFGVDTSSPSAHSLVVLDVSPAQWSKIEQKKIPLPAGWSLEKAIHFPGKTA